jgi:hypothetical protein
MPVDIFELFWPKFSKSEIPEGTKPQINHHFVVNQLLVIFLPFKVLMYVFNGLLLSDHMH